MTKKDVHAQAEKIAKANKLYFGDIVNLSRARPEPPILYYWVLKTPDATDHLASSSHLFESKLDAIRNAITVLGLMLWSGAHYVVDDDDWNLLLEEGIRLEKQDPPQ